MIVLATLACAGLCRPLDASAQTLNMSVDLVRLGIAGRNLTPDDPTLDARPLFQAAVVYVRTHGVRVLTLDRGSYYFLTPQLSIGYLIIEDLADVTIDLAGSTIYFSDPHLLGIQLFYSRRVTLTNFTTDYLNPPYTHARLSSVDPVNRRLHYTTMTGWPDPVIFSGEAAAIETSYVVALVFRDGQIVPGSTRMPVQSLSTGTVDLFQNFEPWTQGPTLSTFRPGDTLVITFRGGQQPVHVWHGDEVTVSHIRILGAGSWALSLDRTANSTVDHVRIEPRPGGLIGSTSDGIHVYQGLRNNHIRNCYITRTVDDAMAIDALAGATVVAQPGSRALQVRRTLYSRFPDGAMVNFVDAQTQAETPGGAIVSQSPPDARHLEANGIVDLAFDRDLPMVAPGSAMVFADASLRGAGSTVEDNVVEDLPFGRGIWISGAAGVTIQRNVIRTTAQGGVTVANSPLADPGPPARDLTIQSNVFEGNLGPAASGTGTQYAMASIIVVSIAPTGRFVPDALNANVVVRDNYVVDSGRAGVWMGEALGGRIENNLITRWYQQPQLPITGLPPDLRAQVIQDHSQPIVVRHSSGVAVTNNDVRPFSSIAAPVTFSSPIIVLPSGAGTSTVGVTPAVSGFLWRATTCDSWIAVTSADGTGAGTFTFTVSSNAGSARTGHVRVAGRSVTVIQAPSAPLATPGLIALMPAAVTAGSVTLNWSLPVGGQAATGFTIVASLVPGGSPLATLPVGPVQSVTVAAPAGVYYVRVHGANAAGSGPVSNEIVVVVGGGSIPAAPLNLTAIATGSTFLLAWATPINAAVAAVQTYVIEAGSASGLSDLANFATGTAATQFVTPVIPNGSYYLRVRARNSAGTGPASSEVRAIVGPPPPNAPTLSGSVGPGNAVSLSWSASSNGAAVTGYQLQAGTAPGASNAAVMSLPVAQTTFAAAGVPAGTYYVRLVALSAQGPSAPSSEVMLTIP